MERARINKTKVCIKCLDYSIRDEDICGAPLFKCSLNFYRILTNNNGRAHIGVHF